MTKEIEWTRADARPEKYDLERGIHQWVKQQTGIENASLRYLGQLTFDDLTLIAMSIGYQPPAPVEKILRDRFKRQAQEKLAREARDAVRAGRAIFLHDETDD